MNLKGSLKVIKRENINKDNSVYIYLENPDDKSKIIEVSIFSHLGKEQFIWESLINLELIDFKDVNISSVEKYYYKGCKIDFCSDRETWQESALIIGNYDLNIKYREIIAYNDDIKSAVAEAIDLIDEAISEKEQQAKAEKLLYEKGNAYYYGKGVEIDYKKAFEIFKDLSDNKQHLGAMEALCYMYYYGKGIDVDYELTRKYCEIIEQKNNECSKNIFQFLGEIYFEGLGIKPDYIKAKTYFEKALRDECDDTYYKLGLLNSGDYGIIKDEEKANDYFNKIEKDLLLSIIYLLLAIRPEDEQNLNGIYKCIEYSREEYDNIFKNNIPFDHLSAIYYKKVNYLNDEEYYNVVKRLKEKIEIYLQKEENSEEKIFTFENENDIYEYTNEIVYIEK